MRDFASAGPGARRLNDDNHMRRDMQLGEIPSSRKGSDVFVMIALGGCAGVVLGLGAARYVVSLFYQVKPTDADTIALPTGAILLTALVATLPAVLLALRTDPTDACIRVTGREFVRTGCG